MTALAAVTVAEALIVSRLVTDGTHAASLMIILPLFLRTPDFAALAPRRERVTQWTVAWGPPW